MDFPLAREYCASAALALVQAAELKSGPNPERLRDVLASGNAIAGVAFLSTGEPRIELRFVVAEYVSAQLSRFASHAVAWG